MGTILMANSPYCQSKVARLFASIALSIRSGVTIIIYPCVKAVSFFRLASQSDDRWCGAEYEFCIGHCQCAASAEGETLVETASTAVDFHHSLGFQSDATGDNCIRVALSSL